MTTLFETAKNANLPRTPQFLLNRTSRQPYLGNRIHAPHASMSNAIVDALTNGVVIRTHIIGGTVQSMYHRCSASLESSAPGTQERQRQSRSRIHSTANVHSKAALTGSTKPELGCGTVHLQCKLRVIDTI